MFQIIERIYAHLNQNKLPNKRVQKAKKPIVVKKSIIEYIEEDNDDDLEEGEIAD